MHDNNPVAIKDTISNLVNETLAEPRSGILSALPETVDILISGLSKQTDLMQTIASISFKDYTTVIHSINVMALVIGYCNYCKFPIDITSRLGLSALMHDIGKTEVPSNILKANRKLTNEEFKIIKSHPFLGGEIITQDPGIDNIIALGALEHHEKLDGKGYPYGKKDLSFDGQLIGLIDCYEALTNEDRPYRRAQKPFDTLMMLKKDVDTNKYNKEIFTTFCKTLS